MGIFSKLFKTKKSTSSDVKIKDDKVEVNVGTKASDSVKTETRYEPEVTATVDPISGYVPPKTIEPVNNITTTEDKNVGEIKMPAKTTKPKTAKKSTGTKKASTSTKPKTTAKKSTEPGSTKSTAKKASTGTKKSTSSSKSKTTKKSTSTASRAKTKSTEDK